MSAFWIKDFSGSDLSDRNNKTVQAVLHLRQQAEHFRLARADQLGGGTQEDN